MAYPPRVALLLDFPLKFESIGGGGTGLVLPVIDTTAIVKGSGDETKQLKFEVDGFTTAQTRVMTPPDQDALLAALNVVQTFTVAQSVDASLQIKNNNELRFYDNGNYVGFEAPALSADQIWVLPTEDGEVKQLLETDGAGTLSWSESASEKSWAFMSRDASSGINYIGGYYDFASSDNDFNPSTTHGSTNAAYGAHILLVTEGGAGTGDTVVRVTGTSITDAGVRVASDTEDITIASAEAANTYHETTKKWNGQVTIAKQSGDDVLCNYGFCKYWDNNNSDFKVLGFEATWLGAQNDASADILLLHHKTTGWTYNIGTEPTPPTAIASMVTDYVTEVQIRNNEEGAWKRDNLSTVINGASGEGTLIELITSANRAYAIGNFIMRIVPQ